MKFGSIWQRLRSSFANSAGTIVFGMEDSAKTVLMVVRPPSTTSVMRKTKIFRRQRAADAGSSRKAGCRIVRAASLRLFARNKSRRRLPG